jgi:hypothetical protein
MWRKRPVKTQIKSECAKRSKYFKVKAMNLNADVRITT